MESMGINVETIDEKGIESRLGGAGFVGGIKYKDDASVHPIRMLHKISERIEQAKSKVELIENAEVFAIESVNGNKLVKTNKTYIEAPMVVLQRMVIARFSMTSLKIRFSQREGRS